MSESFTEISSQSWLSRIVASIKGIVVGLILIVVALAGLSWNEGRAVKRSRDLSEARSAVVTVDAKAVSPGNEGKLVLFSAEARAEGALADDRFPIVVPNGIKLQRIVEMYQWKEQEKSEKRKKLGGGSETVKTYTYDKRWNDAVIDSSRFHQGGHNNPADKRLPNGAALPSYTYYAQQVTAGAFVLPRHPLVADLDAYQPVSLSQPANSPNKVPVGARIEADHYYWGDSSSPNIGDLRVSFRAIRPLMVTVLGQQSGTTLVPYISTGGRQVIELRPVVTDAKGFLALLQQENSRRTWLVRLGGLIVLWIGLALLLNPLKVMADVLPFLGSMVGAGIALMAGVLALAIGLVTIAIAWLAYRPVLGIGLMVLAIAAIVGFKRMRRNRPVHQFPSGAPFPAPAGVPLPPPPPPPPPAVAPPSEARAQG